MTSVALPWLVLTTTGSAARMGAVLAAEFLGMTLLGIPSGRVASTLGPRRSMLASDLARAALVAVVPILHWADALSFPLLLAVSFAIGGSFPAYASSQRLLVAGLVGDREVGLTRVSGGLGAVSETASFLGPAAGGVLVALVGAAGVLLADALSYLIAFALVAGFVPPVRHPGAAPGGGRVLDGLRYVVRRRPLRNRVIGLAIFEAAWAALVATLPVAALRRFGGEATVAGWLLASYGAGSVAGGLISSRARTAGERGAVLAMALMAASTLPLLAPLPPWGMSLSVAATGLGAGLYFPRFFSALTVRTPAALRPTVLTTVHTAISATGPLGFLAAGIVLEGSRSVAPGFALVALAATAGAAIVVTLGKEDELEESPDRERG